MKKRAHQEKIGANAKQLHPKEHKSRATHNLFPKDGLHKIDASRGMVSGSGTHHYERFLGKVLGSRHNSGLRVHDGHRGASHSAMPHTRPVTANPRKKK